MSTHQPFSALSKWLYYLNIMESVLEVKESLHYVAYVLIEEVYFKQNVYLWNYKYVKMAFIIFHTC